MGIIDGKKLPTDVQQWKCKVIGCIMKRPFKLAVHGLLDLSIHAKQHGWWNPHCQPLYSPGANSSDFGRLSRNWLKYEPCMTSIRLSALFAYLGTYILISSFYSFFYLLIYSWERILHFLIVILSTEKDNPFVCSHTAPGHFCLKDVFN